MSNQVYAAILWLELGAWLLLCALDQEPRYIFRFPNGELYGPILLVIAVLFTIIVAPAILVLCTVRRFK